MSATPEEEAENARQFGEACEKWRDIVAVLREIVEGGIALGPVTRRNLANVLRDAEPPGTGAFEIRRGYVQGAQSRLAGEPIETALATHKAIQQAAEIGKLCDRDTSLRYVGKAEGRDVVFKVILRPWATGES